MVRTGGSGLGGWFLSLAGRTQEQGWHLAALNHLAPAYVAGTEIGGAFLSGSMVQPQAPSCFSTPVMGCWPFLLLPGGVLSPHGDIEGAYYAVLHCAAQ